MPPAHRLAPLLLFALALAGAAWRAPEVAPPALEPPSAASASLLPSLFVSEMLPGNDLPASTPTLAELPDGRLAAAWLSGPGDEPAIAFSIRERNGWRPPATIASRASTAGGTFAYVSRVDHPVLYAEGSWLHLWYASSVFDAEAGSSINHSVSTDGGLNWSKPTRLQSSPLASLGSAVHSPPLALADGGILLPISRQLICSHGEALRLAATGGILDKRSLTGPAAGRQPAMAALDGRQALAVLRAVGGGEIQMVRTADGGTHWQAEAAQPIPVSETPPTLLRLKSGRLLLAGNAAGENRSLQLWISVDQGRHWQAGRSLAAPADGSGDCSDPALLLGRDSRIHLACAWRHQGIRHFAFSEAWLDGGEP